MALWWLHGLAAWVGCMDWLRTTKVAFVTNRLGIGYKVCCNGYMG